jgi:FkbM family methyltransferase
MSRNGEKHLISTLARCSGIDAAIDIGMNNGAWSALVRSAAPDAEIHGAEPVPEFAARCRARDVRNLTVHEVAVSDMPGEMVIYRKGGGARSTDFDSRPGTLTEHKVPCLTGSALVERAGLQKLSVIKIDTDGNDMPVLRGFASVLAEMRPVVQFEYGRFWIGTRHFLAEAYAYLESYDYVVGPLMPKGALVGSYKRSYECFQNMNFVAIPTEHPDFQALTV